MIYDVNDIKPIKLGWQYEHNARQFKFNVKPWLDQYEGIEITIAIVPYQDSPSTVDASELDLDTETGILTWTVSGEWLQYPGPARFFLRGEVVPEGESDPSVVIRSNWATALVGESESTENIVPEP